MGDVDRRSVLFIVQSPAQYRGMSVVFSMLLSWRPLLCHDLVAIKLLRVSFTRRYQRLKSGLNFVYCVFNWS